MKIINLTPHEIVYIKADGTKETFPSSGHWRADHQGRRRMALLSAIIDFSGQE